MPPRRMLLPLILALAAGCSHDGSDSGREPVFPVQGQVLFQGKPATGAQVVFQRVGTGGNAPVRASGQVDTAGKFVLTTYAAGDGAPAGEYEVTVERWISRNDNPAVN